MKAEKEEQKVKIAAQKKDSDYDMTANSREEGEKDNGYIHTPSCTLFITVMQQRSGKVAM